MKFSKLALAAATAGLLSAGTAYAQSGWGQASTVQQTAFEYNSYYAQDEDERAGAKERGVEGEVDPDATPSQPDVADAEAEESFGNGAGTLLNPCCCLGDEWRIFDSECLKCRGVVVQGWLGWNPFTWNTSNPADRFNGPVTWTDRSNETTMNQLYLFAEKATDTEGCGWDWGYRIDAMYGTDARFTTASGLETRSYFTSPKWSTQRFYGPALPQFYVEGAYNDLKVKIGHYYAPVGYEVVPTTGNFFPSLPYTFQYGEPFTFTGVQATWQMSENVAIGGGAMQGWDNFDASTPNTGFNLTYVENFSDGASLAITSVASSELTQNSVFRNRYLQTNVYSRPLTNISERLNYVIQSDFGYQNDALLNGHDAYWYGVNQYLFYKVSDCMTYGIRGEWFRDQNGYRVGGFLGPTTVGGPSRGLGTDRAGYVGSFYEVTIGANWKYSANTTVRPYVRFDWFSGSTDPATNPTNLRPFDGGFGNSQTLIGGDIVTIF
jgi:Putative beta-barrel porin-2, OmpL-like. bbp2